MRQMRVQTSWRDTDDKPLPQLPSPTLTNPDYILPSSGAFSILTSPPRLIRRPPSPSYLRDNSGMSDEAVRSGAMGRNDNMMPLRSRMASAGHLNGHTTQQDPQFQESGVPSSPVLKDADNFAPEQPDYLQLPDFSGDRRHSAGGGSSSSELSGMAAFLSKYGKTDGTSDDEALYDTAEGQAPVRVGSSTESEDEMDAERRKQRQDEYNSAILSKRAEQILANAKKRLNVMEGNLRGARDLVAPLTAANLKRATSLGHYPPIPTHSRRHVSNGRDYEDTSQQSPRILHNQASSPTMGRDYYNGHTRGFSEIDIPERPFTSLEGPHYMMSRNVRNLRSAEPAAEQALRSTRSHDSFGSSGVGYGNGRERPSRSRDSLDSGHLAPLPEADETRRSVSHAGHYGSGSNGLGIDYRPSSQTSSLREQMSNLKGKISTLKERAREESLRRQSESNLRSPSLFNNAHAAAPEFFYLSSSSHGSLNLDEPIGVADLASEDGLDSPGFPGPAWDERPSHFTGSRNAFAEKAGLQQHSGQRSRTPNAILPKTPTSRSQAARAQKAPKQLQTTHRRTPSGTAIVESARNRYSHHQYNSSREMPETYLDEADEDDDYLEVPSPGLPQDQYMSSPTSTDIDADGAPSEDGMSVYEDAKNEQKSVVAHEDREDAFDYENFFLHSALGTYGNDRRGSDSTEGSVSSTETAKGPASGGDDVDDDTEQGFALFPPPTPETPERLREIEWNLHKRSFSNESISTLNTYATADEELASPSDESDREYAPAPGAAAAAHTHNGGFRPFHEPAQQATSRPASGPTSRPSTAVKRTMRRESGSERADSGVGSFRRSIGSNDTLPNPNSTTPKAHNARSAGSAKSTPPMSPRIAAPPPSSSQDPAAVAVNALLNPQGKALGLRSKAVVFGVAESLRKIVRQLQDEDDGLGDDRALLARLEAAKLALDGRGG